MHRLRLLVCCAIAALSAFVAAPAAACPALKQVAGTQKDATGILRDCIERTESGGKLELPAARFLLRQQLRILKPITITTKGVANSAANCNSLGVGKCARLVIKLDGRPNPNIMPIEVVGEGITFSHLVLQGSSDAGVIADCKLPDRRPLGGGIRVLGSKFTIRKSVLRDFTCYTTMEVLDRAKKLLVEDNHIGPNGDHRPGDVWTDGVTIHDSADTTVRRNVFVDNTDVQLILGGCRRCRIEDNVFRHSGDFSRASFAELMLQAFPSTSGDYTGTVVTRNRIDCGKKHLCGYGIMIGANPWEAGENPRYPGAMFGGTITKNKVANALIGINIDSPTGPVAIYGNEVASSGGRFRSDCGTKNWPAVNVAPGAGRFVRGDPSNLSEGSTSSTSCIVNRQPE